MSALDKIKKNLLILERGKRIDGSAKKYQKLVGQNFDEDTSGDDTIDFSSLDPNEGGAPLYSSNHMLEVNLNVGYAHKYIKDANGDVRKYSNDVSYIKNVIGSNGNDILRGNDENNVIIGGDGDDDISGGKGDDVTIGGKGNTLYGYFEKNFGNDIVFDMGGTNDIIDLAWNDRTNISLNNTFLQRSDNNLVITFSAVNNEKTPQGSITIANYFGDVDNQVEVLRFKAAQGSEKFYNDLDLVQLASGLESNGEKKSVDTLLSPKFEIADFAEVRDAMKDALVIPDLVQPEMTIGEIFSCDFPKAPTFEENAPILKSLDFGEKISNMVDLFKQQNAIFKDESMIACFGSSEGNKRMPVDSITMLIAAGQ